jgi:phosphoadenosine phosphosulfate reductase
MGVRWAESAKRKAQRAQFEFKQPNKRPSINLNNDNDAQRRMVETCMKKRQIVINPIVDWEDSDVWDFLRQQRVPTNPMYNQGYTRIGCIGCPMSMKKDRYLDNWPTYKRAYITAGGKYLERLKAEGKFNSKVWDTPEHYYKWWREEKWVNTDPMLDGWDFDDD